MVSYFSLMKVLLPVHVDVKWGKAFLCPVFMGGLSPLLYRLVVPPAMLKIVKTLAPAKTLAALKFTDFKQTIAVFISAHRHPIKERKKHKCSLSLSNIKIEADLEIQHCGLKLFKRGMGDGGALLCSSFHLSDKQVQRVAAGYAHRIEHLPLSHKYLFSFSTFLCLAASWMGVEKNIHTICAEQRVFPKYWRLTWEVLEGPLEVLDAHLALASHNGALEAHQRAVETYTGLSWRNMHVPFLWKS